MNKMRGSHLLIFAASLLSAGAAAAVTPTAAPEMHFRRDQLEDYKGKKENPEIPEYRPPRKSSEFGRQDEAFASAAETGVYLQAYQYLYGPYGIKQNAADRNRKLQETAQAIQDCVSGNSCDSDKQNLILTALMEYNSGKSMKQYVLTNNTYRENMRTIQDVVPDKSPHEPGFDAAKIQESLIHGSSAVGAKSAKANLFYSTGTSKPPLYQMDEKNLRLTVSEQDILGDKFINDYRDFVRGYSKIDRARDAGRYYKYIPAKPRGGGESVYVIDPSLTVDQAKLSEAESEQNNERIQKIVSNYADNVKSPTFKRFVDSADGKEKASIENPIGAEVGMGQVTGVPQIEENGQKRDATDDERFIAVARGLNAEFKDAADRSKKENEAKIRNIASGASQAPGEPIDKVGPVNVTLNPAKFDEFLDEIWPSAAVRRQRLQNGGRAEVQPRAGDPTQN
jgi:hypothetical protein